MSKHSYLNHNKAVPLVTPGTGTGSAVNSDWVGVAHGTGVAFQVVINEGRGANDDNTLSFRQASAAAGTGAKALVPRRAYRRAHATDLASAAAATPEEIAGGDLHIDGEMNTIYDVEFDASELDLANNFSHIQARLGGVGSSTTTISITATVCDLRHAVDPTETPNVLA